MRRTTLRAIHHTAANTARDHSSFMAQAPPLADRCSTTSNTKREPT